MESYGEILRKAREEKAVDLEIIARETSITQEYLEALEKEDVSAFPGEPYLVGFLKNYAEYLEVDVNRVITLYHAKKIQEAPPPLALTARERPRFLIPLIATLCIILLVGLIITFSLILKNKLAERAEEAALARGTEFKKYELTEKPFSGRLYKSDQLVMGSEKGNIFLTVAETEGIFGLETPTGIQYVELSEELELDVDGNSIPELIVYVSDVSQKNVDRGAEVKIMLKNASSVAIASPDENQIPNAEDLPKEQSRTEIFSDTRAYPFTINASFRGGCLFRYRPDRKETVEDYFASGDILSMTASNGIRMWISNGNAVKLQVVANSKTYDLAVPRAGEVIAQDIKWIKDTDGRYKVVIVDID
ncbi:MAG: helix-turn-helix domain-containing protein [Treponema sp.]|uniref:helix-turn-helix domain-containing protein n=1 Tax=Treponema sp. TaxID=166 RepID=UPI001B0E483D|nr:helix-turn-helix domain-containing protein [Treponema sp.]MBO6218126.1 helix-turn-helix domain-containing protein [Treponema sp.]MBQ8679638.1 helix-turn-helix domain-containing protein [Treponema sp.]